MMRLATILSVLATQALGETPMSGAEFDAYSTGRTLTFGTIGNPDYGVEQYLPDRKVIWSPGPGRCVEGSWFDRGDNICFVYETDPEPKCWQVYRTETGIRAVFTNQPGTTVLFESKDNTKPLVCPGPDLLG
ncbi:hypothetical protein SAMN04488515_0562 [Cognatiyoonia koreensis]|uniref:Protease inhibitor Inh n=1 Tax=Cognatiyoonia koreensis TaxID=364200 RepID=A0A1I0NE38_9RHOB|nr:hypothetical protein [Cognatiyoonia koreensis]SEV99463.1 hypothetical protein SAMN04488515_0562 [Cognatiyoonia koreensis]